MSYTECGMWNMCYEERELWMYELEHIYIIIHYTAFSNKPFVSILLIELKKNIQISGL